MDSTSSATNPLHSRNIGGRNQQLKQQGPPLVKRGPSGLSVKYSMGNHDFSMHESMSGDFSSGGDDNSGDEADNEEEPNDDVQVQPLPSLDEEQPNRENVIVHSVETVNISTTPPAAPQQTADNNATQHADRGTSNFKQPPIKHYKTAPTQVGADAKAPSRHPVVQRPRGVDLSSSSEEYEDPRSVYVPAIQNRANAGKLTKKHSVSGGILVDDSQYEELEAEEEKRENQGGSSSMKPQQKYKYDNQFMRIPVPASELKPAASVEKDVDHDKPRLGRRMSLIKGLQRAMSGARLDESERPRASPEKKVTGMQRTSSRRGGLSRTSGVIGPSNAASSIERTSANDNQAKNNNVTNPVKRQAVGDLGRMISMNRQKAAAKTAAVGEGSSASATSTGPTVTINAPPSKTEKTEKTENSDPVSNVSISQISISQESMSTLRNRKDGTTLDDRTVALPASNQSMSSLGDRPRSSGQMGGPGLGRRSIGQMGRMMSRGRRKSVMHVGGDGSHGQGGQNGERSGTRSSLSRIGRALSFNRGKTAIQQKQNQTQQPNGSKHHIGDDGKEISPLSTSTISMSTTGVNSSPMADRARTPDTGLGSSANSDTRKESRLGLRNAGRMFSFTRKSGMGGADGGERQQRNSGFIGRQSRQLLSNSKSSTNIKKHNMGDGNVGSGAAAGSKVEGRADKFVYSEVTSAAIIQSGLIGNGKHIRVAQIAIGEYAFPLSRDKWYVEVFTLAHNAVRRECIDLYDMLSALARCDASEKDICDDDINALERWWLVAHSLLRSYFDMERGILFPWVDSAGSQEWEVQLALKKMRSLKDKLETLLSKVDKVWNEKTFKSAGEMYSIVYKAVDDFVPRLMNYFSDQEMLLPAIIREFYKREHAMEIDKQIVGAFMNPPDTKPNSTSAMDTSKYNLVALVRGIPKTKQMRAWLGRYLSSSERSLYPSWYQMYDENHTAIVTQLRGRAGTV